MIWSDDKENSDGSDNRNKVGNDTDIVAEFGVRVNVYLFRLQRPQVPIPNN